ncbi:hypothetical protein [Hymenobacter psoromatis]|uniref:hypothetical protein n=1 Tax=Hymenobacter psoromatis TaxID=1484116 RepID=UPI001CC04CC9|nr:hypothetical protein [Hymenobacter psoromatis]
MKTLLRFLLLPPLLALAGCCANSPCNCQDTLADSLYFSLNQDVASGKGFSATEVDTVYLLRYNPAAAGTTYDSLLLTRQQLRRNQRNTLLLKNKLILAGLGDDTIPSLDTLKTTVVLSNAYPFSPGTTGGKLSNYYYKLLIKDKSMKNTKSYSFLINQIVLGGQYKADGCCTCYENTQKQVNVNGQPYTVTEVGGGGATSIPVPIVLSKP